MINPLIRNTIFLLIIAALALPAFCTTATGQDEEQITQKEITDLKAMMKELKRELAPLKEAISEEAGEELAKKGKELKNLLDVEAMMEEVADRIELSKRERKKVHGLLEDFRDHWVEGESIHLDDNGDEWFDELLDEADESLERDHAKAFTKWLKGHKKKVDRSADELAEAAEAFSADIAVWAEKFGEDFGENIGEWAEKFGEDFGENMEDWAEDFGAHMEDWAEVYAEGFGDHIEDWAEDFSEHMEEWAEDYSENIADNAEHIGDWAEDYGERWAEWAEGFAEHMGDLSEESAEEYSELAQQYALEIVEKLPELINEDAFRELENLARLTEEDMEVLHLHLNGIVEHAVHGMDWERFGEDLSEMIEQACEGAGSIKIFEDEDFQQNISEYTEKVQKASDALREALQKKRSHWDKKQKHHLQALQKALGELGEISDLEEEWDEAEELGEIEVWEEEEERDEDEEADERDIRLRKRLERIFEEEDEDAQRDLLRNLKKQQVEIRKRDEEMRELKDEIRALQHEIQKMNKEQRERQRALEKANRELEKRKRGV
jgi:hypothetical protein